MAQPGFCNTKKNPAAKCRNYCFTINNYDEKDIEAIKGIKADHVFQEETGENGTPHLQGLLMFKNAVSFKWLKRALPTAHLESCRNKNASIIYCSKEATRTGQIYSTIDLSGIGTMAQGKKTKKKFDVDEARIKICDELIADVWTEYNKKWH